METTGKKIKEGKNPMTLDLERCKREALEAKERAEKATAGPWFITPNAPGVVRFGPSPMDGFLIGRSAEFVAASRTDVPTLVDAVLELIAEVERLEKERDDFKEMYELNIERPEQGL